MVPSGFRREGRRASVVQPWLTLWQLRLQDGTGVGLPWCRDSWQRGGPGELVAALWCGGSTAVPRKDRLLGEPRHQRPRAFPVGRWRAPCYRLLLSGISGAARWSGVACPALVALQGCSGGRACFLAPSGPQPLHVSVPSFVWCVTPLAAEGVCCARSPTMTVEKPGPSVSQ